MHLLAAQKGTLNESDEAIDLGQDPADILFLSAADTELSSIAAAHAKLDPQKVSLRVANLIQLSHPMSVDVYADNTAASSRFILVRVLGGESYWQYGLEKLLETAQQRGCRLVVLPGDDKPDPGLVRFNTVPGEVAERCWEYLKDGGPENMANLLGYILHCLDGEEEPTPPKALMKAGVWSPQSGITDLQTLRNAWLPGAGTVAICFYRALIQSGNLEPIEALIEALKAQEINALPIFISSLKDPVTVETVRAIFSQETPELVLNATGFAVSSPNGETIPTVLEETGCPVFQTVFAGISEGAWRSSSQGLSSRDLAMNIALPEVDGRIFTRAVAFKDASTFDPKVQANLVVHRSHPGRVAFVAELAARWLRLRRASNDQKRVAVVLANYPNRDGRLGNGVGLDTPAGTIAVIHALAQQGYSIEGVPIDGDALIDHLREGPTNAATDGRLVREVVSLEAYEAFFSTLSEQVRNAITGKWGQPQDDPFFLADKNAFGVPISVFGNVAVGIQPARGYNIDPVDTYHSPDLVPPHGYLAFYAWIRGSFDAHAVVHMGKHGNLEWLPGKALSLSPECYPEAVFGAVPNFYPFIVNDPGEGTQAKRRLSSVIVDHLTPPLTRAESYGPLRDLEALVDEYYEAAGQDPRRLKLLKKQILELIADIGLDADVGIVDGDRDEEKLEKLDGYLCELKEMQIRDGLHVFGKSPAGRLETDLVTALVRVPRALGKAADQSLQRAIAEDLELGFDPLDCDMSAPYHGPKPDLLHQTSGDVWRSLGDSVERIELLAVKLVGGDVLCPSGWDATQATLVQVREQIIPLVRSCGERELHGLMTGLEGGFVGSGPSGAPTRGRLDVLPTGRNFFSVDSRSVPTPAAWELGKKSAELLIRRYRQDHGEWPSSFGLSAWGTSNMRTGGDDIAQAMALIGARPVWDHASRRVTGFEVLSTAELGRPRVDVTLRISGFFRDAFPAQIDLFDRAVRAVGGLEEAEKDNPIAKRMSRERKKNLDRGMDAATAERNAGYRIFGSKPGAYGAGLQALIDEKGWDRTEDLAEAYLVWGGYAYGSKEEGTEDKESFKKRLAGIQAVVHNQDNREHDLLDSDDYYQFEGGMTAAVEVASGKRPKVYHNDHSRPERPVVRALEDEIARVVRARAANPKWINGVMRHGYKGAFEIAATVDYLFAFAATTGAVGNHHFELLHNAYLADDTVRSFLQEKNPDALREIAERFLEAIEREMWVPRSNSAKFDLEVLARSSKP